jgi:hypothetical protein
MAYGVGTEQSTSDVYIQITDQSISLPGGATLKGVAFGFSPKGPVGQLLELNASTFKDIIGYDINTYPEMIGLSMMLQNVPTMEFIRVNKNPYIANKYLLGGTFQSLAQVKTLEQIQVLEPDFYVAHTTPGNWGKFAVAIQKSGGQLRKDIDIAGATSTTPVTAVTQVPDNDFFDTHTTSVYKNLYLALQTSPNAPSAFVKTAVNVTGKHDIVEWRTVPTDQPNPHYLGVVDFDTTLPNVSVSIDAWCASHSITPVADDFVNNLDSMNSGGSSPSTTPTVWKYDGTVWTNTNDAIETPPYTTQIVVPIQQWVIVGDVGIDISSASFTITQPLEAGNDVAIMSYSSSPVTYKLLYAKDNEGTWEVQNNYTFSLTPEDDNYYKKISMDDLAVEFKGDAIADTFDYGTYLSLDNGDAGSVPLTVDYLDLVGLLDDSNANVAVLNGLTQDQGIISIFGEKFKDKRCTFLVDAPPFARWADLKLWQSTLAPATEYMQLYAVPDQTELENGNIAFIWPSVYAFNVYANMQGTYNSINYVPAGYPNGAIGATDLLKTDYHLHTDELKQLKVNYLRVGTQGPVIWEQKTRYPKLSDLSYAHTVAILRDLQQRLVAYMEGFLFQFTSPENLLIMQTGLQMILDNMVANRFLATYLLVVPSFEEAQRAGKVLDIKIQVAVMQDSEVINLNIILRNMANIGS